MIRLRVLPRMFTIHSTLVRHGLGELVAKIHLLRGLKPLIYLTPRFWFTRRDVPLGVRIREALEELGPVFVKFGQAVSTRRDLLPTEVADELAKLQEQVPPFPGDQARRIIEAALGASVTEIFAEFEETPMASASVAQVHKATLHDGRKMVVKVLRPGVEADIRRDLEVMYEIARLAERFWKPARRLHPLEVVAEYEKTILDELDLMREAANAALLRRNWEDSPIYYVPDVEWDLCRTNVMVMERIHGTPVSQIAEMERAGVDIKLLSERAVEIFFTQVFKHNFFHADMHPGNIFVDATEPANPRWLGVDFGIMGSLSVADQHYLAQNFVAFFNRDYRRVSELHIESGWVPKHVRVEEFEAAIRTVCEPIFNKPLKDISFGNLLVSLFRTARRFEMEVQPQLVLLEKTLLQIEGLGRQLYPELDLWETAKPFLEGWMSERIGPKGFFNRLQDQMPEVGETLKDLPRLLASTLRKIEKGGLEIQVHAPEVDALREEMQADRKRRFWVHLGSVALLAAALLYGLGSAPLWLSGSLAGIGLLAFVAGRPR
jgi:ubiquinone biosynthesis protein